MICERVQMANGSAAFICRDGRRPKCSACGNPGATLLCDGPPRPGSRRKTCDAPLCERCTTRVGQVMRLPSAEERKAGVAPDPDTRDLCPRCAGKAPKEDPMHGGPTRTASQALQLPFDGREVTSAAAEALARARAHAAPSELPRPGEPSPSAPPEREPGCDDGDEEPRPNSPEDVGFTSFEISKPAAPLHTPHVCKSCGAAIFWAQILDESGHRVRTESGRMKAMPVNAATDLAGNVVLFHRPGEGIVCRVLRRGEEPPAGARLRTSHFATCPNASKHRRSR